MTARVRPRFLGAFTVVKKVVNARRIERFPYSRVGFTEVSHCRRNSASLRQRVWRSAIASRGLDSDLPPPARDAEGRADAYFGGGLAVVGVAGLGLAVVSTDLSNPTAVWAVGAMSLLGGAGCALFNAQITAFAVSSVPADRAATAAAMCVTLGQVGFALGIALIGAVLNRGGANRRRSSACQRIETRRQQRRPYSARPLRYSK